MTTTMGIQGRKALPQIPQPATVQIQICETPAALEAAQCSLAPGLAYRKELQALWSPEADPERFVYKGILAVSLARVGDRIGGWGQLLVARPIYGEGFSATAFCRVARLDVAPAFRRRSFTDARSGQPLSVLLLTALLKAAPFGSEVVAEVTPDAENLFEQLGFKLLESGRWAYLGA